MATAEQRHDSADLFRPFSYALAGIFALAWRGPELTKAQDRGGNPPSRPGALARPVW